MVDLAAMSSSAATVFLERAPVRVQDRMLRYLDGPQKLIMRQISKKFSAIVDEHR